MSSLTRNALLLSAVLLASNVAAQESSRTSLGISGCFPAARSVGASANNLIVFAGCEGPKGMFYSRNQGRSWTFAGGGAYSAGEGRPIFLTSQYAFMNDDDTGILRTSLPESAGAAWSPDWQPLSGVEHHRVYAAIGDYLVLYHQPGTIAIYNSADDTLSDTVLIDDAHMENPQVMSGGSGQYVFIASGLWFAPGDDSPRTTKLHYIGFNSASGLFTGDTWTTVNISAAGGIPAGSKNKIQQMEIAPDNKIYLALPSTEGCNQPVYVSQDLGQTFSDTTLCAPMRQSSFSASGDNYLLETNMTRNGGASWLDLADDRPGTLDQHISLDPSVVLIDQSTAADWAIFRSNVGFDRASGLSGGPVQWTRAFEGFEALEMYDLAKSPVNPDRVLISNRAGYAISGDFSSEEPQWIHPFCPNGDCYGGRAAAAHLSDENVFFMGGNPWIYKVQFDFSASPPDSTVTQFILKPSETTFYGQLYTSSILPNTLVACYQLVQGGKDGGLYFYNLDTGQEIKHALAGTPINRFAAVSSQIMFAAIGAENDNFPAEAYRGVYRSADGGTTWSKVASSFLGGITLVNNFAYDADNDILYAVTKNAGSQEAAILRLKNAAAGNETWESATGSTPLPVPAGEDPLQDIFMTAVTVDPATGKVAVAGGQQGRKPKVWVSVNHGNDWALVYNGLMAETVHFLNYDFVQEVSGIGVRSADSRLSQGSSTGLYALDTGALGCRVKLSVEKACKKAVSKGAKCLVTTKVRNNGANTPLAQARLRLERALNKAGPWAPFGQVKRSSKKGLMTVKGKVKKSYFYRANVVSPLSCTSNAQRIRVLKKKGR